MIKFCKEKWEENEEKFRQYVADNKLYVCECDYKDFAQVVLNSILKDIDNGMFWKVVGEYYTELETGVWYAIVVDTLAEDIFATKINYVSRFDNALLECQEELEKTGNIDKIVELARQLIANLEPVYNTERWYRKK